MRHQLGQARSDRENLLAVAARYKVRRERKREREREKERESERERLVITMQDNCYSVSTCS